MKRTNGLFLVEDGRLLMAQIQDPDSDPRIARRLMVWQEYFPGIYAPVLMNAGYEMVNWNIKREKALDIFDRGSSEFNSSDVNLNDVADARQNLEMARSFMFTVYFERKRVGLLKRIWIAKPVVWYAPGEDISGDSKEFGFGFVAARNEKQMVRALRDFFDGNGRARLYESPGLATAMI
jgi:hypothetical protein